MMDKKDVVNFCFGRDKTKRSRKNLKEPLCENNCGKLTSERGLLEFGHI
jgi:hypothetical protein